MSVTYIGKSEATSIVVARHYLHRAPPISHAYGLIDDVGTEVFLGHQIGKLTNEINGAG